MVVVTLSDPAGRREKQFRATTAAAFLREARAAFGAGTVEGPDHITLTDEAGDLVEGGAYTWTATPGEQHSLRGVRRGLQSDACYTVSQTGLAAD